MVSGTFYLKAACCASLILGDAKFAELNDAGFDAFMFLDSVLTEHRVRSSIDPVTRQFQLDSFGNSTWTTNFRMQTRAGQDIMEGTCNPPAMATRCDQMHLGGGQIYAAIGNAYSGEFRCVSDSWFGTDELLVKLSFCSSTSPEDHLGAHLRAVAVLDASGHANVTRNSSGADGHPFYFEGLEVCKLCHDGFEDNAAFWCCISDSNDSTGAQLHNESLHIVSSVSGGTPGFLESGILEADRVRRCFYSITWKVGFQDAVDEPAKSVRVAYQNGREHAGFMSTFGKPQTAAAAIRSLGDAVDLVRSLPNDSICWFVTEMCVGPMSTKWMHSGLVGLIRSLSLHHDTPKCILADLQHSSQDHSSLLASAPHNSEVLVKRADHLIAAGLDKLRRNQLIGLDKHSFCRHAQYVISGGTGALGQLFGHWLLERNAGSIVLLSRQGQRADTLEHLREQKIQCDVSCQIAVGATMQQLFVVSKTSVCGFVHAAGIAQHLALEDVTRDQVLSVLSPKLTGAHNMSCEGSSLGQAGAHSHTLSLDGYLGSLDGYLDGYLCVYQICLLCFRRHRRCLG